MTKPFPGALYEEEPQAPPPETSSASRWEDFIDIFYAPSAVFERRKRAGFGVPMLVVVIALSVILFAASNVMQPVFDAEIGRNMAAAARKNPQLTPDALEKGRGLATIAIKAGVIVGTPVTLFVLGIFLWIVGRFFDAKQTVGAAIMVASYAWVPRIVAGLAASVQALLVDPASLNGMMRLSVGPARFLDPDTVSPVVLAMLGRLDVFVIWSTLLLAIGLAVTGGISRQKAGIAAFTVWLLAGVLPVLQALQAS